MADNTHGLAQSRTHAIAAKAYSEALASGDAHKIEDARVVLRAAYLAYTNPHKEQKAVYPDGTTTARL